MNINKNIYIVKEELNTIYSKIQSNDLDMYDYYNIQKDLIEIVLKLTAILNDIKDGKNYLGKTIERDILTISSVALLASSFTNKLFLIPAIMTSLRSIKLSSTIYEIEKPNTIKLIDLVDDMTDLTTYYAEIVDMKISNLLDVDRDDLFKKDLTNEEINKCANMLLSYVLNQENIETYEQKLTELLAICNPKIVNEFINLLNKRCDINADYMEKIKLIRYKLFGKSNDEKKLQK